MPLRTLIYNIIWVVIILILGFSIVGFFVIGTEGVSRGFTNTTNSIKEYISDVITGTSGEDSSLLVDAENANPFEIQLGNIADTEFNPPQSGKAVRANLETMVITLYENGKEIENIPIMNKGRPGSYWETPGGTFEVNYKTENHFSSFGNVWMPYSIHFFGNFFIHGEPYDTFGKKVSSTYSGGCIRLADGNAKRVFEWVDKDTIVSVYSDTETVPEQSSLNSAYFVRDPLYSKPASVTSKAYVVGDLATGDILLEHNADQVYPIASVSKMFTSLVSLDFLNQNIETTVSKTALDTYGTSGSLRLGQKIKVGDLLYPLMLESSNDAAEVLAEAYGRKSFIANMNKKAETIGLEHTSFEDPSGLSPNNVSTAKDLLRMMSYVQTYKNYLLDLSKLPKKSVLANTWYNISGMTSMTGFIGGKTGYIPEANRTTVAAFKLPLSEFGSRDIGITFLQSDDRLGDLQKILSYVQKNIYYSARDRSDVVAAITKDGIPISLPPPTTNEVTIGFVGDIMLDRGVKSSVIKNFKGDFNTLFANVGFISDYDILFGNLEGPVSDTGEDQGNLYSFRMDPKILNALSSAGFDVLSIANNHIGDWGQNAFNDTLARINSSGILAVGGGQTKIDATEPKIIERNGLSIGFLGFSDVGPDWMKATTNTPGILLANDPDFAGIIQRASSRVDTLVVSIHWGEEYELTTERQRELGRLAIDSGARLVIGTHPHIIQETEGYNNGYIAYSLGNFIFDQDFSKDTMKGMLLEVKIKKGEIEAVTKKVVTLNGMFQPQKITPFDE